MKHVSLMIKPASSLCNMRCQYCFYADISSLRDVPNHGVMHPETSEAILHNFLGGLQRGDKATIAFQGGEPTMAGLAYFTHFVQAAKKLQSGIQISYALQTNGLLLNESWCSFLKQNNVLVGLSLDGYAEMHNNSRPDAGGKGTFTRVLKAKTLLEQAGVEYNVLCTLTNTLARHPGKVWATLLQQHIRYVQFTPCMGKLYGQPDQWALTPKRFHSFYKTLFAYWKNEVKKGNYISVKLFDDIVNLFVRREITACGLHGYCSLQPVIEADGSVYPCDFYALDEYKAGNLATQPFSKVLSSLQSTNFLSSREPLPPACAECKYLQACNGGCKRMQSVMYVDETGFCGYQALLNDILQELCQIGRWLLAQGR